MISSSDYEALVSVARQYAILQRNLINGGVSEDTIAVRAPLNQFGLCSAGTLRQLTLVQFLSRETEPQEMPTQDGSCYVSQAHDGGGGGGRRRAGLPANTRPSNTKLNPCDQAGSSYRGYGYGTGQSHGNSGGFASQSFGSNSQQQAWADVDVPDDNMSSPYFADGYKPEPVQPVQPIFQQQPQQQPQQQQQEHQEARRPRYARVCNRTILLCGLPDGAKHADIVNIVRGGLVLNIYIRAHEHIANVSFLREEDAVRFYEHARRYDLHLDNKRVSGSKLVLWEWALTSSLVAALHQVG